MIILTIKLTLIFNSYIILTEINLKLLHRIKSDIEGILSWIKKELKKDVLIKTMEVKV
jgi:hypothetical protein